MTTPSSAILRVPGQLVLGPTDLSAAYPYGGTPVGLSQNVIFDRRPRFSPDFVAEERGGDAYDGIWLGEDLGASAVLTQFTEDSVAACGWAYASGSGNLPSMSYPAAGGAPPQKLTSRAVTLLFVPEEVVQGGSDTGDRALGWILHRAHPAIQEPIPFSGFRTAMLFVAWKALPDDDGKVGQLAAFGDLVL